MDRTSMPEAPIDEHGQASARKDHVRPDVSCGDRDGVILAKAQAEPVELGSQSQLRARVSPAITPHNR